MGGVRVWVAGGLRVAVGAAVVDDTAGDDSAAGASPFVADASSAGGVSTVTVDLHVAPGSALLVRPPVDGDRFHPPGRAGPVRLVEYLRKAGVASHHRAAVPVVALRPGHHEAGHPETIVAVPPVVASGFDADAPGSDVPTACIRITISR